MPETVNRQEVNNCICKLVNQEINNFVAYIPEKKNTLFVDYELKWMQNSRKVEVFENIS